MASTLPDRIPPPFQLSLPAFEGPIPELVRLVEAGRMPARDLPLAALTDQFVTRIQPAEALDLQAAGDFLRAATRLMLLKSESLLPTVAAPSEPDEEAPAASPDRLVDHPGFHRAAALLAERQGIESFPGAPRVGAVERPIEPRTPALLRRAWEELRHRQADAAVHVAPPAFLRLEVALSRLVRGLRSRSRLSFQSLLRGASRNDAVIHFLAVLELVRRRQASASQETPFGEISLQPFETDVEARSRAG